MALILLRETIGLHVLRCEKWVPLAKEDKPLMNRAMRPINSPHAIIPYWQWKSIDAAKKESKGFCSHYIEPHTKSAVSRNIAGRMSSGWAKNRECRERWKRTLRRFLNRS